MIKKIFLGLVICLLMSSLVSAQDSSAQQIQDKITNSLSKNSYISRWISQSEICVLVHQDNSIYSYDVDINHNTLSVNFNHNIFCDGLENEDFVINFIDYNYFNGLAKHVENFNYKSIPSLSIYLAFGARFDQYQILPSEFLEKGGKLNQNNEFQEKYSKLFEYASRYSKINKYIKDKPYYKIEKPSYKKIGEPVIEEPEEEEIVEVVEEEETVEEEEITEVEVVEEAEEEETPEFIKVKEVEEENTKPQGFSLNGRSGRFVDFEELGIIIK